MMSSDQTLHDLRCPQAIDEEFDRQDLDNHGLLTGRLGIHDLQELLERCVWGGFSFRILGCFL